MDGGWRCRKYGPLGWMEALIKALAIGVAYASLSIYASADEKILLGTRIGLVVLFTVLGASLVALLVHRVLDRELFALGFAIFHLIGHWILTIVVFVVKDPGVFVFTYTFLMALGEITKVGWIVLTDVIEIKFMTKPILFAISGLYIAVYIIIIILQVVIWLVEY